MALPSSWLFVRGGESVWIERPGGYSLIVAGPGGAGERHDFDGEQALQAFQIDIAERLTAGGWFLWAFDRDRRITRDRRQGQRGTDRRRIVRTQAAQAGRG